jgi:hypothetical protein
MSLVRIVQVCYFPDMGYAIARQTPTGVMIYIRRDMPAAEKRVVLREALRKERVNPVRREIAVIGATAWWAQTGRRRRLVTATGAVVSLAAVTAGVVVAFSTGGVPPHRPGSQPPVYALPHPTPNPVPAHTPSRTVKGGTAAPASPFGPAPRTVGFVMPTMATVPAQSETPPKRHTRPVPVPSTGTKPDTQTVVPVTPEPSTPAASRSRPVIALCASVVVVGVCVRA